MDVAPRLVRQAAPCEGDGGLSCLLPWEIKFLLHRLLALTMYSVSGWMPCCAVVNLTNGGQASLPLNPLNTVVWNFCPCTRYLISTCRRLEQPTGSSGNFETTRILEAAMAGCGVINIHIVTSAREKAQQRTVIRFFVLNTDQCKED